MNDYICFYNGQEKVIHANTSYEAQLKAVEYFRPIKNKKHMVHVHLAEVVGKQVITTITN